uniref:Reverse transcriptase domain-containing protein n=1 Tax=Leptobrachium leishanense TaxID=445787 RepID=A0A8C5MRY5_9ANUR
MARVVRADIHSITWSDHADISLQLAVPQSSGPWKWKLNASLLRDPDVIAQTRVALDQYFTENASEEMSPATVWAAHKAVIRGHFIKIATFRKKQKLSLALDLQAQLHRLEQQHKADPTPSGLVALNEVRRALKQLFLDDVAKSLTWSRRTFYEQSNKLDSLLARSLRPRGTYKSISSVRAGNGRVVTSPDAIAQVFTEFYDRLYNHSRAQGEGAGSATGVIDDFLNSTPLTALTQAQSDTLGEPIAMPEVSRALAGLNGMKAPGPDGFHGGYYKTFKKILLPHLTNLFNALRGETRLHPDMTLADIALLPKEGRDASRPENYRPISLLNFDIKLLAKILADRLNPMLTSLIHPDQVGFIPGRQLYENTRRGADLVWWAGSTRTPSLLLSLDAEKAFDRVTWPFLFRLLVRLGLPDNFINVIKALYENPRAQIKLQGASRSPFTISNGTRQGCPLSPILFVLALEPLLTRIRQSPHIQGVPLGNHRFTVSAYADDILLSLTDPLRSMRHLHDLLTHYGSLSGFKVNLTKSQAMPLHMSPEMVADMASSFRIPIVRTSLKYLGVSLTSDPTRLFSANIPPVIRQIKKDLEDWTEKPISWIGRIHSVKMNILPRLLFLFQALPVAVTRRDLAGIQSAIDAFVWQNKRRRVARKILYRPKTRGGLGLPNLYMYYCAAQLAQVVAWHAPAADRRWVTLETALTSPDRPHMALWLPRPSRPLPRTVCPAIANSLRIFDLACSKFSLATTPSPMTPLFRNPAFPPGMNLPDFKTLEASGLRRFGDILTGGKKVTFADLSARASLRPFDYFRFMQLRHYIDTEALVPIANTPLNWFEKLCSAASVPRGLISTIYYALCSGSKEWGELAYCARWEADLQESLTGDEWEEIWEATAKSSICVTHQEQSFKMLFRWYTTPVLLCRMGRTTSDLCWRNCGLQGTFIHLWWDCPRVKEYWGKVGRLLTSIFHRPVHVDPWDFLLSRPKTGFTNPEQSLLRCVLLAARRALASQWLSDVLPTMRLVKAKVSDVRLMEELTAIVRQTIPKFEKTWHLWEDYLGVTS